MDPEGARIYPYYSTTVSQPVGSGVPSGMGGAVVMEGIWVHEENLGLDSGVQAVLREGSCDRLPVVDEIDTIY